MSKISAAQTGILMPGPGGVRLNELLARLSPLTAEQMESVNRAKKYALEQSMKSLLQKQVAPSSQHQQQKSVQRHQALVLMCRVYVGSISFEVREETIKGIFSPFGAIKSINMSWDPISLKHKGFAFVEYEIPEAAQLALEQMNGVQVGGRQIKVGRPSNMPQAAPIIQQIQEECKSNNRIYIANIHPDLSEQELHDLFDPFGKVRSCNLAMTPNVEQPQHRGHGFIEFETEAAASEALTMDKCDLGGGQALHVCRATTPAENLTIYGTLDVEKSTASAATATVTTKLGEETPSNPDNNNFTETIETVERADDQLKPESRTQAKQQHATSAANSEQTNDLSNETNGTSGANVSNVLMLRNMVSADEEIDDSLQLDVYEECAKFGPITQVVIHVEKVASRLEANDKTQTNSDVQQSDQVKIFVKFKNSSGSYNARQALDGRFYAGRRVSADYYDQQSFKLSDYGQQATLSPLQLPG